MPGRRRSAGEPPRPDWEAGCSASEVLFRPPPGLPDRRFPPDRASAGRSGLRIAHGPEDFGCLNDKFRVGLLDDGRQGAAGQTAQLDQCRPHIGVFGGAGRIGQHRNQRPDGRCACAPANRSGLEGVCPARVLELSDQPGDSLRVCSRALRAAMTASASRFPSGCNAALPERSRNMRGAKLLAQVGQLV